MTRIRLLALGCLATLLSLGATARAQQASPRIGYALPAGGAAGSTFEVTVGGQFLDGAHDIHVTGEGVKGTVVEFVKPLTPTQQQLLRDEQRELQDKKAAAMGRTPPPRNPTTATRPGTRPATQPATGPTTRPTTRPTWTAQDEARLTEIRKKLAMPQRRRVAPAIAEVATLRITIDAKAKPGPRELRLQTTAGLTNPLVFYVDSIPEVTLTEQSKRVSVPAASLPVIVNGQIMPGETDRFRFKAKKGQRIVVAAEARGLMPYLSDAVPGWFQAAIAVTDENGKEIAFADHHGFEQDPVMYLEIPADGEYFAVIRDSIYRGREDFVYRVSIGEFPYVISVFPLGAQAGSQADIEVSGWNLPSQKYTVDTRKLAGGINTISVLNGRTYGRVGFAVDSLPEALEQRSNSTIASAQSVTLPVIVNGRISSAGQWHVFKIDGRAGQEIVAEVIARRLGSPLDSQLRITDASGKQLAFNDDFDDKAAGLVTHQADSYVKCMIPTDGPYFVHLGDAQNKGGPSYGFRLRLGAPQPDFELRVTPSSLNVRGGTSAAMTVHAIRRDGFAGEIKLGLKDAPSGFSLQGGRIPAGQDQVKLTLRAPQGMFHEPLAVLVEGTASIKGQSVSRVAIPAEDMMQAFYYRHLVPAQALMVEVLTRGVGRGEIKLVSATPVKLSPGETSKFLVKMPMNVPAGKLTLELGDPPDGVALQDISATNDGTQLTFACDAARGRPGAKGNLLLTVMLERSPPGAAANAPKRRIPVGSLPAIPYEVVAK